ncbi:MAG: hypothetical protein NWQ54_24270 [Paraglaciecola sp.]|nr:hypothetical protein [Paraglaciecola sp.]MDP5134013.1 hypothetical protein [Paraglaciecola sp.]
MKYLLTFLIIVSCNALANDELKSIYLAFESDYMSNDAEKYSDWLIDQYEIVQTMHVPGMGSDSRTVTGKQMIGFMKKMNKPNSTPRSTIENTTIRLTDNTGFCASSNTVATTKVSGKDYEEKETREVCFRKIDSNFKAIEHKIDVYYKKL